MAEDLSTLSDEELLSVLSDDDLKQIAGIKSDFNDKKMQDQNILGRILNVPGATSRAAIQSNPTLAIGGPLAGLLGLSGVGGPEAQQAASRGAMNPDSIPRFQTKAIDASQKMTDVGTNVISGMIPSAAGLAADIATDPSSMLLSTVGQLPVIKNMNATINASPIGKKIEDIMNKERSIPDIMKLLPKKYTDSLVSNTVNSVAEKVNGALKPVQEKYKNLTSPFLEKPVDGETFQKALSVVPKEMRQDLIEKYGTAILDSNGRPQTNLANLQAMELGLKEDIIQPKFGASINSSSYDIAKATKQIKELRLSQYPEETRNSILELDKKFGPLMEASKEILPKVTNRAGVANTKAVYSIFNDPANAGKRDYMVSDLKKLGIDLSPEVKVLKGWVARQGQKKVLRNISSIAAEGTIIGKAIKAVSH